MTGFRTKSLENLTVEQVSEILDIFHNSRKSEDDFFDDIMDAFEDEDQMVEADKKQAKEELEDITEIYAAAINRAFTDLNIQSVRSHADEDGEEVTVSLINPNRDLLNLLVEYAKNNGE